MGRVTDKILITEKLDLANIFLANNHSQREVARILEGNECVFRKNLWKVSFNYLKAVGEK